MKRVIIIILTCCYSFINAQDINHIKTLDTIYIKFKKSKNQTLEVTSDGTYRFYTFYLGKKSNREYLNFIKPDYKNNSNNQNIFFLPRIENKSFLKKHKRSIIGIKFFNRQGIINSTYTVFENSKVIYIIDCDDSKKGKIILYKVLKSSSYTMGE